MFEACICLSISIAGLYTIKELIKFFGLTYFHPSTKKVVFFLIIVLICLFVYGVSLIPQIKR